MSLNPNSFEALKSQLSQQTLKDIEGIDSLKFGFERDECCQNIPSTLPNSMKLTQHVILGTSMRHKDWAPRTQNVPWYKELNEKVREANPQAMFTVCEAQENEGQWLMRFRIDDKFGTLQAMQYSMQYSMRENSCELPWKEKGTFAYERSNDYFIFVCSHTSRDARCGYCGPILIDLLRRSFRTKLGQQKARKVGVYPCSHVGGHVYAGNVIVYSKHGGVCFGLFKPTDVQPLVNSIIEGNGSIPIALRARIRGKMSIRGDVLQCNAM